jgi:hypothetical protein
MEQPPCYTIPRNSDPSFPAKNTAVSGDRKVPQPLALLGYYTLGEGFRVRAKSGETLPGDLALGEGETRQIYWDGNIEVA